MIAEFQTTCESLFKLLVGFPKPNHTGTSGNIQVDRAWHEHEQFWTGN